MTAPAFVYDYVCLPPDRQIGMHSQSTWELACVLCGGGFRTIGDVTEPMAEGEVVLIPPHIPHVWNFDPLVTDAEGNIVNMAVFFEPSVLDGIETLFSEATSIVARLKSVQGAIAYTGSVCDNICRLLLSMRDIGPEARLPRMFELLALIADTDNSTPVGGNAFMRRSERRMERLRVFCSCNYARDLSLGEVAAYVGMNKSALCTFIRRHTGRSFSEYVNGFRLEKAVEQLQHSDYTVAEIAYSVGFANVTYFNRLFRRRYGCTPLGMRRGGVS